MFPRVNDRYPIECPYCEDGMMDYEKGRSRVKCDNCAGTKLC